MMRLALSCCALMCAQAYAAPTTTGRSDDFFAVTDTRPLPSVTAEPASSDTSPKPESPFSQTYAQILWTDTKDMVTEPLRWDRSDWRDAGLIAGGLVLTGAFLDKPIRDEAQRGRSHGSDRFFTHVERFGTKQYGVPVLAGFYLYGSLAGDGNSQKVALDGFSASVVSALVSSSLKGIVGRARPNTGLGPGHFRPFRHDYSFPSGHATGAFTFASVIASHYESPWVDATAYGIASLVGIARIRLDAHWTSDVVAGAFIGTMIGRHVVELNRKLRAEHSAWVPTIGGDGNQFTLAWGF